MSTRPTTPRQVGIALSGGGARCFAQIGALAALEEEGLRPRAIAANSSAAIVAAFYAAGNTARANEPDGLVQKVTALFSSGGPNGVDILMRSYAITQARLLDILIAAHPPDVWLRPDLPDDLEVQCFDRLDDAIASGYACVKEAAAAGRFEAIRSDDAG